VTNLADAVFFPYDTPLFYKNKAFRVVIFDKDCKMCVELDPTVNNENVFVVNILSVDLEQEKADLRVRIRKSLTK
jgi:hypothetical protein